LLLHAIMPVSIEQYLQIRALSQVRAEFRKKSSDQEPGVVEAVVFELGKAHRVADAMDGGRHDRDELPGEIAERFAVSATWHDGADPVGHVAGRDETFQGVVSRGFV